LPGHLTRSRQPQRFGKFPADRISHSHWHVSLALSTSTFTDFIQNQIPDRQSEIAKPKNGHLDDVVGHKRWIFCDRSVVVAEAQTAVRR
jgi:hypothetical protein